MDYDQASCFGGETYMLFDIRNTEQQGLYTVKKSLAYLVLTYMAYKNLE